MKRYRELKWNKLSILEEKCDNFTPDELHFLYTMSKSKNVEFRIKAAELLVDCYTKESEDVLYHMTFDKEYLVKLNAVDSLCIGKSQKSLQRLHFLMSDKDYLIRSYAIMSYFDVIKNIYSNVPKNFIDEIISKSKTEENEWVKAIIYRTLYIEGVDEYLVKLIHLYQTVTYKCNYTVVWCLLNVFDEIISEDNYKRIIGKIFDNYDNVLQAQKEKINKIVLEWNR